MAPYTNVVCPDCGHHTRVKCELGHYLLTSRHAAGGMSMVFVARDTTLERDVAIKLLNEEYSRDAKRMEEFEHEAKITAALSHPHIVRVFTVGKTFDHYYIAMEMVSGDNLEQKIAASGAIGEDEMLPIALEIISGLRAAKTAGVIHRDMKPGNILFDDAGHVKIVDFGLALLTKGGTAKAEEIWATPYYVPPEALDGEEEDFRSDIYALGATLYHALSGKPPLPSAAKSTREVRKAKEDIPPLADVAPWLNSATCLLVDKAMALKPEDRFASYAEMEDVWNTAFQIMRGGGADEPIHSEDRLRRRRNKKKGVLSLVVVGLLSLVLIVIVASFFVGDSDSDADGVGRGGDEADALSAAATVGQSNLQKGDADYDPEVAARIGRLFRSAHVLLKRKKYSEAQKEFTKLMSDPDVGEPLASWARIESLVAVWLGGDSSASAKALSQLEKYKPTTHSGQSEEMVELERLLCSPGIIQVSEVSGEPMAVVQLMAMALKNWELGAWDEAVNLFAMVGDHPLPSRSPLMVYRDISKRYLSDYKKLKSFSDMGPAADVREAQSRIKDLKKQLGLLQTRGRARFHIRVWQLRLHRQMKQFKVTEGSGLAPVDPPATSQNYAKLLTEFHQMVSEARFTEASALLQRASLQGAEQKSARDAWVYLADSSNVFLGQLEQAIPEGGITMQIKGDSDDGYEVGYKKVISSKPGGLLLMGSAGEVFVSWGRIEPLSVIDLFKEVLTPSLSTTEGQMHTEMAISYAWLSGLEDKATLAAVKLAEANRGFGRRWKKTMQEIKAKP